MPSVKGSFYAFFGIGLLIKLTDTALGYYDIFGTSPQQIQTMSTLGRLFIFLIFLL